MKRLYGIAGLSLLAAGVAAAQDDVVKLKAKLDAERVAAQSKIVALRGAAIGNTVKNAPYSAVEVSEHTQVLADGTRIHTESRTSVYRDSEGRLRRETPTEITIWDPVANTSYVLNPQTMTARKISVYSNFTFSATDGKVTTFRLATPPPAEAAVTHEIMVQHLDEAKEARMEAELKVLDEKLRAATAAAAGEIRKVEVARVAGGGGGVMVRRTHSDNPPSTEALGRQTIEGVPADGTRVTSTIETGSIGNDRPIKVVTERWHSAELQTLIMSRSTDPRNGEDSFRLVNINRGEPAAYLFEVPAGYQLPEK